MSIQVIGLNPAVDVEWRVERYLWNEKTIVESSRSWAGGKPPNVARWLKYLGFESVLLTPLGGEPGRLILGDLKKWGVKVDQIAISEATRTNVMVTPDIGQQLRFNPKGPKLSATEWQTVFAKAESGFGRHSLTILSGSLPRGASPGIHARLIRLARKRHRRVILDCDGQTLRLGVKAKPFMVKPNRFELSQWCDRPLSKRRDFITAARELSGVTGGWVFLSLDAGGAILVNDGDDYVATAIVPKVNARNEVGAGDSLLAQLAGRVEESDDAEDWLRWSVATGTAFVQVPAGTLPKKSLIRQMAEEIRIKRLK
jgi:1-phosphofructokinase family hexose kinase